MMMTGRFMDAQEAHQAGLTNYLVEPEDLEGRTMELALEVEAGPPIGQKVGKLLAYKTASMDFENAILWSEMALPLVTFSNDRIEGVNSFVEKREPRFDGR
jgi:enoyl-CoA hydratase/carnithine racemase